MSLSSKSRVPMIPTHEIVTGILIWSTLVVLQGLWLVQGLWPHRFFPRLRSGRVLLGISIVVHVVMIVSLDTGWFDPLGMEPAYSGPGYDFGAVHSAGVAIADGGSPYDMGYGHPTPYRYLPFPALLSAFTLSLLRSKVAYWIWVLLGEVALLGFYRWVFRRHPGNPRRPWAMGTVFISYPLFGQFHAGQFDLAMGLLMLLCAILLLEGRERAALTAWILSILTKLYSFALVPSLLMRRRYLWVGLGVAILALLSVPWILRLDNGGIHGVVGIEYFLRNVHQADYPWLGHSGMRHLVYLSARRSLEAVASPTVAVSAARWMSLTYAAVVTAFTLFTTWRRRHVWSLADDFLLWVVTFFLVAGDVWIFSYMAILPWLALRGVGARNVAVQVGVGLLALPSAWIFVYLTHPGARGGDYALHPLVEILFRTPQAVGMAVVYLWAVRSSRPLPEDVLGSSPRIV